MEPDDTERNRWRAPLPTTADGKLDLIIWRLTELEKDLQGTLPRTEYETRHRQINDRVSELERVRKEEAKERRGLMVGILVALSVPALRAVFEVMQSMEGMG